MSGFEFEINGQRLSGRDFDEFRRMNTQPTNDLIDSIIGHFKSESYQDAQVIESRLLTPDENDKLKG